EWWYYVDVTLHARCADWRFAVVTGPRANSNNITSSDLYVEATFNNLKFQGNSSAYFSVRPVPNICKSQSYTYNNGAVDPNFDSVSTAVVRAQTAIGCAAVPGNISFNVGSPAYSIPANPLQTANSF